MAPRSNLGCAVACAAGRQSAGVADGHGGGRGRRGSAGRQRRCRSRRKRCRSGRRPATQAPPSALRQGLLEHSVTLTPPNGAKCHGGRAAGRHIWFMPLQPDFVLDRQPTPRYAILGLLRFREQFPVSSLGCLLYGESDSARCCCRWAAICERGCLH